MAGPDADPEGVDRTVTDQPEARTELLYLNSCPGGAPGHPGHKIYQTGWRGL